MRNGRIIALLAFVFSVSAASAQTPAEFYKGKQVTLITSASVGGGYDQYARLLAKHMPRFIPGNPVIVVQNMPGADGLRAANYLYNVAPQDGSVIGGLARNNGVTKFYTPDNAQVQFDARKFHWLAAAGDRPVRLADGERRKNHRRSQDNRDYDKLNRAQFASIDLSAHVE